MCDVGQGYYSSAHRICWSGFVNNECFHSHGSGDDDDDDDDG